MERLALIVQGYSYELEHRPGTELGLPDALSRRHYDVEFDAELEEAQHLGVIMKLQEMRDAERREFEEKEKILSPEQNRY